MTEWRWVESQRKVLFVARVRTMSGGVSLKAVNPPGGFGALRRRHPRHTIRRLGIGCALATPWLPGLNLESRPAPKPPIAIRPPSTYPNVQTSRPNQIDWSNPRTGSSGLELRRHCDSGMRSLPCPAMLTRTASTAAGPKGPRLGLPVCTRRPHPSKRSGGLDTDGLEEGDVRLAGSQKPVGCSDPDSVSERSAGALSPRRPPFNDPLIQSVPSGRGWASPVNDPASCASPALCGVWTARGFQGPVDVETRVPCVAQRGISF